MDALVIYDCVGVICCHLSGPFLVSRTGDVGCSERLVRTPNYWLIPETIKVVDPFRQ